jgi:hypothetical protein
MIKYSIAAVSAFLWVSSAFATTINSIQPNDNIAGAQNINGYFSLDASADIDSSTTIPHVTIVGLGDTQGSADYFKFTVGGLGGMAIFDIDYTTDPIGGDFPEDGYDSWIQLYTIGGSLIAENDDSNPLTDGAGGSWQAADSFIKTNYLAPGTYVIAVGSFNGGYGDFILPGYEYTLHVSVETPFVPEVDVPDNGSTLVLLGGALLTLGAVRRRFFAA